MKKHRKWISVCLLIVACAGIFSFAVCAAAPRAPITLSQLPGTDINVILDEMKNHPLDFLRGLFLELISLAWTKITNAYFTVVDFILSLFGKA